MVPTWESSIGLQGKHAHEMRCSRWEVRATKGGSSMVDGTYQLLPKCGAPMDSHHKRVTTTSSNNPPMYFFLESTRQGNARTDGFVFSTSAFTRLAYREHRPSTVVRLSLEGQWRPDNTKGKVQTVSACRYGWKDVEERGGAVTLTMAQELDSAVVTSWNQGTSSGTSSKTSNSGGDIVKNDCQEHHVLLSVRAPLHSGAGNDWPSDGNWQDVDRVREWNSSPSFEWQRTWR